MKTKLDHISTLTSGIYSKPDIVADTLYLQVTNFSETGHFDTNVKPQIKLSNKYEKHLLKDHDILFAAKGFNNFGVVYNKSIGEAVASSSFIIIRITDQFKKQILPEYLIWYINNNSQVEVFHKRKAASTVPSISISQLSKLEIDIPDLATQRLVVNTQQLRDKERNLTLRLEELKDAQMKNILLNAIKKNDHED